MKPMSTDVDFSPGRAAAGVRSFHNATIFLTEASGEVCGLRNPDGRVTEVRVNVSVSELVDVGFGVVRICVLTLRHVLVFVPEKVLYEDVSVYSGLAVWNGLINVSVPFRVVALVVVGLVSGGDNRLGPV